MRPKRVLLVFPEFSTWKAGCLMGYGVSWALEQGFEALGIECTVIPGLLKETASMSSTHEPCSWLRFAREICDGKKYDQVWIEACHLNYDENFLDWLATLAPIRLGFVAESLTYSAETLKDQPYLAARESWVTNRMPYFTHAMLTDDRDVTRMNQLGIVPTIFWSMGIPSQYVHSNWSAPSERVPYGVFYGTPYGERKKYLEHPKLAGKLLQATTPEWDTDMPQIYDRLGGITERYLDGGNPYSAELYSTYIEGTKLLRRRSHEMWLTGLSRCTAVVALPQFGWTYSNRPYDTLAVGRPIVNFRITNNPLVDVLFEEGKEILLYSSPEELEHHLERLLGDPAYAAAIGQAGQAKIARYYTLDRRITETFRWIETGEEPLIAGVIKAGMRSPESSQAPSTSTSI